LNDSSILIGVSQALAIIPGVSRSGITMSVGRAAGIDRESIAKFTFLLSTPIILGDALYRAKDLSSVNIDMLPFIVAVVTAAIVGILSIKFLLNYLKTKSFFIFTVYRFVFGARVNGAQYRPFTGSRRNLNPDSKRKYKRRNVKDESKEVWFVSGIILSSDGAAVMAVERRNSVIYTSEMKQPEMGGFDERRKAVRL
jgi:hypothetical protein